MKGKKTSAKARVVSGADFIAPGAKAQQIQARQFLSGDSQKIFVVKKKNREYGKNDNLGHGCIA
jgi:hypothetical protein